MEATEIVTAAEVAGAADAAVMAIAAETIDPEEASATEVSVDLKNTTCQTRFSSQACLKR